MCGVEKYFPKAMCKMFVPIIWFGPTFLMEQHEKSAPLRSHALQHNDKSMKIRK